MNCRALVARLSVALLVLVMVPVVFAANLAETLRKELGPKPSRAKIMEALRRHAPKGLDVKAEEVLLPAEYTKIIFGEEMNSFIESAQRTNPFLNPEAAKSGFMVSNEVKDLAAWPFSPTNGGAAFLTPRFVMPATDVQIGNMIDKKDIQPDLLKHMISVDPKTGKQMLSFWFHPENPDAYSDFVAGGAKAPGVPKEGYGVIWDYVSIAPNGPRSLMALSTSQPQLKPLWVKVNLHMKLDGSSRIIAPHKAARSILATRLLQENLTPEIEQKWGFRFLPEVLADSLPFSKRSNVIRDPTRLTEIKGSTYVYAYAVFSPHTSGKKEDIVARQILGEKATKKEFEKLARQTFRLMARPFAYHALVSGANFEWHSANWMVERKADGTLGDHVMLQDMEALRYDPKIGIWNGGSAAGMQAVQQPWLLAKYGNAIGEVWEGHQDPNHADPNSDEAYVELNAPDFLADEYLWRVRGLKESASPKDQTTIENLWGFSTVVDAARNFGVGIMGYNLTNAEVERWMDEEMAKAFNEVLRTELKIPKNVIADVTADQILHEVKLTKGYEALSYGVKGVMSGDEVKNIRARLATEGGLVRALHQVRAYLYDKTTTRVPAIPEMQELLAEEGNRLTSMQRNTRKEWAELSTTRKRNKQTFLFHEKARIIEVRDETYGWLGFISLEADHKPGTQAFYQAAANILKRPVAGFKPQAVAVAADGTAGPTLVKTRARTKTCSAVIGSDVTKLPQSFGDRSGGTKIYR
ncbi:MAG TPA: hypothetical protein VM432_04240 [Bdellovibrionales bacterium]|nr:hypothetical protein [Bdellovibrionales bacterium]